MLETNNPLRRLRKYVPTDMDWAGTFAGGYCEVSIYSHENFHNVYVGGTDDCHVAREFENWTEALALFNSICYVQSNADLVAFRADQPGSNNNGWPGSRPIYPSEFTYPEPTDDDWIRPSQYSPRWQL